MSLCTLENIVPGLLSWKSTDFLTLSMLQNKSLTLKSKIKNIELH